MANQFLHQNLTYGDVSRLHVADTAIVNNALFNLNSGCIIVEDYAFLGHNVLLLTGTHDYNKYGRERQESIPQYGRDIIVKQGAWIATGAIIIGPCHIGEHSVVAAGAIVKDDVPSYSIVAGSPARVVKHLEPRLE